MPNTTWRDEWPAFRVKLIDETARCFANQQAAVTNGQQPDWASLTSEQQENLTHDIVRTFLAQEQAMDNLVKRGLIP